MNDKPLYWVWLTMAFGPANARKWNTLMHYDSSPEKLYEAVSSGRFENVLPQDTARVSRTRLADAERLMEYCRSRGINIICYDDEDYPLGLKEIYNPPSVLFTLGSLEGINSLKLIASVGTRRASEYSVKITSRICSDLASKGVGIVSGFAVGLDSVSLSSCIAAGGRAFSVLPCGLEATYPRERSLAENEKLRRSVAVSGALISEYLPDEKTNSIYFRARNRIISGMSKGVLITQAGAKSGALSTASFAISHGRDIFCIPPHELFNESYSGVIPLIRDGATPVFEAEDILGEYNYSRTHRMKLETASSLKKNVPVYEEVKTEKKDTPVLINTDGLSEEKKKIIEFVSARGSCLFDEIADGVSDVADIETILTELELEGFIKSLSGNRYTI